MRGGGWKTGTNGTNERDKRDWKGIGEGWEKDERDGSPTGGIERTRGGIERMGGMWE